MKLTGGTQIKHFDESATSKTGICPYSLELLLWICRVHAYVHAHFLVHLAEITFPRNLCR